MNAVRLRSLALLAILLAAGASFAGCIQKGDADLPVKLRNSTNQSISIHLTATTAGKTVFDTHANAQAGGTQNLGYINGPKGSYTLTATMGNATKTLTADLDSATAGWLVTVTSSGIEFAWATV